MGESIVKHGAITSLNQTYISFVWKFFRVCKSTHMFYALNFSLIFHVNKIVSTCIRDPDHVMT